MEIKVNERMHEHRGTHRPTQSDQGIGLGPAVTAPPPDPEDRGHTEPEQNHQEDPNHPVIIERVDVVVVGPLGPRLVIDPRHMEMLQIEAGRSGAEDRRLFPDLDPILKQLEPEVSGLVS